VPGPGGEESRRGEPKGSRGHPLRPSLLHSTHFRVRQETDGPRLNKHSRMKIIAGGERS